MIIVLFVVVLPQGGLREQDTFGKELGLNATHKPSFGGIVGGLQPVPYFCPRMGVEQETVFHRLHHLCETTDGNGETKFVASHPRAHRWVEKAKETTIALPFVLDNGHRNNATAS